MAFWQDGFLGKELIEGDAWTIGAKSLMKYKMGKRNLDLTEIIKVNELPDYFSAFYISDHTENLMSSTFQELAPNSTLFESEVEYTALNGFMVKAMAFIAPGIFKKQVQKWLDQFKVYAEQTWNGD